eukprot:gene9155-12350_t
MLTHVIIGFKLLPTKSQLILRTVAYMYKQSLIKYPSIKNIKSSFGTIIDNNNAPIQNSDKGKREVSLPRPPQIRKIVLNENDFSEEFTKGSGNGGQKINTTSNKVRLKHHETGIVVACQETRDLTTNRKIARKILIEKLDLLWNGEESKISKKHEKLRKTKLKSARRAKKKYQNNENDEK